MARRRGYSRERGRSAPAGYIVRRGEEEHAQGKTYKQIAADFGMNERTYRKLRTGETSGTQLFRKGRQPPSGNERDRWTILVTDPETGKKTGVDVLVPRSTKFDRYRIENADETREAVEEAIQVQRGGSAPWTPEQAAAAEIGQAVMVGHHNQAAIPLVIL